MSNSEPIELHQLPVEHLLRNTPLREIRAEQRLKFKEAWVSISEGCKIAGVTYNDLGAVWTDTADWRGYLPAL
jgi:hypothetical protein